MNNISKRLATVVIAIALIVSTFTIVSFNTEVKASNEEVGDLLLNGAEQGIAMYRLYNPINGEHLYTKDNNEKNVLLNRGWNYEGYSWIAYNSGSPVYRVFNPYSGEHHYTMDIGEKIYLVSSGWNDEGIGWYSNSTGDECEVSVYRLFCPFTNEALKAHHYTMNESERDWLISQGWNYEGTCWVSMHNVSNGSITPATCVSTGYSAGAVCNICGKTYDGVVLPIDYNNHIHTSFVPAESKTVDRSYKSDDLCCVMYCRHCGEEIYRCGDEDIDPNYEITWGDWGDLFILHLNAKHGTNYHTSLDYLNGIITGDEWQAELEEWCNFNTTIRSEYIPAYIETIVTPAHTHCNDCGRDIN